MWKVKKSLLEDMCRSAQNYYPQEFMCFLGGNKKNQTIDEIVFIPTRTDQFSASVEELSIPFDPGIVGSLHSHPSGANTPSRQDKRFFAKYEINAILGHPYTVERIAFYNKKGERDAVTIL